MNALSCFCDLFSSSAGAMNKWRFAVKDRNNKLGDSVTYDFEDDQDMFFSWF